MFAETFRRKGLISNHDKYRPSLEMQLYMAEYPDLKQNDPSFMQAGKGFNLYDPAFAQTSDTDQLAMNFKQPYYATQNYSKPQQREPRFSRNVDFEDINSREEPTLAAQPFPKSRAISSRPAGYSTLARSGQQQIGDPSTMPRNPIAGFSDGEAQRMIFSKQYAQYAKKELQSSLSSAEKKSKLARLSARIKEEQETKVESMATLMRQTRHYAYPNEFALKQRYQYSKGTLHKSDSNDAFKPMDNQMAQQQLNIVNQKSPEFVPSSALLLHQKKAAQEPTGKIGAFQDKYQRNDNRTSIAGFTHPGGYNLGQINRGSDKGSKSPPKMPIIVENDQHRQELLQKEQQKMEYKAILMEQIAQKEEQKKLAAQRLKDEEERFMQEFNQYRVGAKTQGGGSPIRDHNGEIITQHIPFAAQLKNEGAVNYQYQQRLMSAPRKQEENEGYDTNNNIEVGYGSFSQKKGASPNRQELIHMRPSNNFEDITEDQFNKREQNKKQYQNELFQQMQEARSRKETEKQKRLQEDWAEEQKIKDQLRQIGEQNRKDIKKENDAEQPQSRLKSDYKVDQRTTHSSIKVEQTRDRSRSKDKESQFDNGRFFQVNMIEPSAYTHEPLQYAKYDGSFNEQMERLRRMQEEIDKRNEEERRQTSNLINEIMNQSRIMMGGRQLRSQNLGSFGLQGMSDNLHGVTEITPIRHESQFQPLKENRSHNISQYINAPIAPNQGQPKMAAERNLIETADYQKDDLGKLDELIGGFQMQE